MTNQEKQYTPTLNPDLANSIPTLTSVRGKTRTQTDGYAVGTIDESMLTPEEKQMVEQYASEIDITNVDQIVKYGVSAQRNISDFSVSILKKVKTYDMGEIGESLKELTVALDATVEPEKKGIIGLFQKAKRGVGSIRANYAKAETNVTRIEEDLLSHETVLIQDISVYQQMYELNLQYYKELTMYIFAGKKALDQAKAGKLLELQAIAERTNKQEDVQAYRDYEDLCYRFEKKLADLEITRVIAIQSAPQVRLLQNNDRELLDKLQSSIANTIPLWRNQLVLSLGIEHTKRAWIPTGLFVWAVIKGIRLGNLQNRMIIIVIALHSMLDFNLQFIAIFFILLAAIDLDEKKPKRFATKQMLVAGTVLIGAVSIYLGTASGLSYLKMYSAAVSVYPNNTSAWMEILAEAEDVEKMEWAADKILAQNESNSLANTAKARAAYAEGDFGTMIAYKKKAIAASKYSLEEYLDYFNMLYVGEQLYAENGDIASAEQCRKCMQEIPEMIEKVLEETDPLAYKIKDKPELELPEEYVEILERWY